MQDTPLRTMMLLASIGAIIGIGQLLKGQEPVTWRAAFGRAIVVAGISCAGGLIQLLYPNAPLIAILGAGAFLGSLGTDTLISLLRKYVVKK